MKLIKPCHGSIRAAGSSRKHRSLPVLRAYAQPHSLNLATASAGSLPTSYRAITTDPNFRPTTTGCSQYAPGPPQLLGRHITLNPVHGLAAWAEERLSALDRAAAGVLDGRPLAHAAAAAATAALTYWGLHPLALLQRGLPALLVDALELGWGLGEAGVAAAGWVLLAAGAAAAAWQLRTWWAAQLALIRIDQVAPGAAATKRPDPGQRTQAPAAEAAATQAADSAAGAAVSEAGPLSHTVPEPLHGIFETDWKATDRNWLYAILAARMGTLLTAANCLLHGATTAAAAYAAVCFGASLLPLALPHLRHLLAAPPALPGGAAALAAPLLAADAAFLLTLAPVAAAAPVMRAAGAAALAVGLGLAAVAAAASPRLAGVRAAPGDVATFHITLRLPNSGTLIDTTVGHQPLVAVVGGVPAAGSNAEAAAGSATHGSVPAGGAAAVGDPRFVGSTAGEVSDPHARFRPLQAAMAATALAGLYVGGRRTVTVQGGLSDGEGGEAAAAQPFHNPGLVWWQSREDLVRKLTSAGVSSEQRVVRPGDVFWYPVGHLVSELGTTRLSTRAAAAAAAGDNGGAVAALAGAESWGPVQVVAVADEWVQLDANVGLAAGEVEVEVELVSLRKVTKAAEAEAGAAEAPVQAEAVAR